MWFSALKLAAKAGAHVYQNRQKTKMLMADAQMRHAEKMLMDKRSTKVNY